MAPSRRKGASKAATAAAAAAAARRQWKVGDLVLAKVKGFPAWPATVSEPEKWGYSSDWKKVLVYFFGTKQIAFCNPADVEPFTEEKKQSLLVKRQGRGADFVRAVQEIVDCYEKLKKQDLVDDSNSGDVVTLANGANSLDSSGSKDLIDTSEAMLDLKISNSITAGNDPSLPTEDASSGEKMDDLCDRESIPVQPADHLLVKEKPTLATYSSRKRYGGLQSQKSVAQRKAPSVQRTINSSRLESSKFQNSVMSYNDGSSDDNGSEIATVESDTVSLDDSSTIDSHCILECSESVVGCLEGDAELNKALNFQTKAIVVKKKRKPNRKRVAMANDPSEPTTRGEVEADLKVEMHNTRQTSQNTSDSLNVKYCREDGDEHLPLVKRARVRMGRLSSADDSNCLSRVEENTFNGVAVDSLRQISSSSNCHAGSPTDGDPIEAKGDLVIESPSKIVTQVSGDIPQPLKDSRNQFGCSADGEAALPPSKRLHRALEAMSANAAEEGKACDEPSATLNTLVDGCCDSPVGVCSKMDAVEKDASNLELEGVDSLGNGASAFVSTSNSTLLDKPIKSSMKAATCNQPASPDNKNHECCTDVILDTWDQNGGENNSWPLIDTFTVQHVEQTQHLDRLSPNLGKEQACFRSNTDSLDQQLLSKDCNNAENIDSSNPRSENIDDQLDNSKHIKISPDPSGLVPNKTLEIPDQDGANVPQHAAEYSCYTNNESFKSQIDESTLVNDMHEVMEDVHCKEKKINSSALISDGHLSDKDGLGIQLSPPSTDGVDSVARVSPLNISIGDMSTSESANIIQENGCCSPNVHSHQNKTFCATTAYDEGKTESAGSDRPRSVSKCNNYAEVHAALSSFENMLGTLTRAKESILRATRIAIDCAKFGVSAKVVEILARHLECESSLKRRVDLFFLVDSITQYSRGLKGDFGSIYPSAIQAELPRLLSAAAPPGSIAHDNRRQCLKVLRVWMERKILPESVIRQHIREIDSLSRRSARTERAFDDPVREMEGMLVDEYGSNSSFQLPGFCMPCMLKDENEGSDSDEERFEAVTPEHYSVTPEEQEVSSSIEKHRHILEDVDGELEMEDVAPCEVEMSSTCSVAGVSIAQTLQDQSVQHYHLPLTPPLPHDVPPSSPPPLPSSPPPPPPSSPPPPPPPPVIAPCPMSGSSYTNGVDSRIYNVQDELRQPMAPSVPPRVDSTLCTNAVPYQGPESADFHVTSQVSDCNNSYNSYPARPLSNMQQIDGPSFHHKAYPPCPPYHAPSDQFSFVHTGQHMKSQREAPPPSYSNRFHHSPHGEGRNFYSSHERMKPVPYGRRESWRGPAPSFSGPCYPDRDRASYGPSSYGHPPCEPARFPNQGWGYPPRDMNHRNSFPMRPPPEGAVPVGSRAPSMWWPR
ncbi:hypothetical protein SLEP1_g1138 [Rubroshorea leprosula]|uniref:Uncharacterized protein n=1 Tax=Rubroshorea leprosula TaxID=152421 RepID=A0AAV5HLM0_9ROSI|nr:hypothetical protein SLEP1_g1138 [Rubroshorea leprosula]